VVAVISTLLLSFLLAVALAIFHLDFVARWTLQHTFQTLVVDIGSLRFGSYDTLTVSKLVVRDRESKEEIIRLDGGTAIFHFADLLHFQLGEIRLKHPFLRVSPAIGKLLSGNGATGAPRKPGSWTIRRLVCDYGEISFEGFGDAVPTVTAKLAFDLRDLSPQAGDKGQPHELSVWDLRADVSGGKRPPFLSLDVVTLRFGLGELLQAQSLASIDIAGGDLVVGDDLRKVVGTGTPATASPGAPLPVSGWKVGELKIRDVRTRVEDSRPEVADIAFKISSTMKDIPLQKAAETLRDSEQSIEISDLEVYSPFDAFSKVITLGSVFVRFTLRELVDRQIREIVILRPTIHVGRDLFWYMEEAKKAGGDNGGQPGWTVRRLHVEFGRVVLGGEGREHLGLPLNFQTDATDVALDNLSSLRLNAALEVPKQSYTFDSYQLHLDDLEGTFRFAYPADQSPDNLVPVFHLARLRWTKYESQKLWIAASVDKTGVNGKFGGQAYGGYIGGGFAFFFSDGSPWIGWLSGDRIDLGQLTAVASPQNIQMTGKLTFRLQLNANGKDIERIKGQADIPKPGKLKITKLDDLLAMLPDRWSELKRSLTRIGLENLRDFDYTHAKGDFWFVESQGILNLSLVGPLGSRNFEVVLHADESPDGLWKKQP